MKLFQVLLQWWVLISATSGLYFCYSKCVSMKGLDQSNCPMQFGTDFIIVLCYGCCLFFVIVIVIFYALPRSVHTNLFRPGLTYSTVQSPS